MQEQIDPQRVELGQEADQVLQAAAEAIDVPGHDDIELPLGSVPVQGIEGRPLVAPLGAADAVILLDLHHAPAGAFIGLAQLGFLSRSESRGAVLAWTWGWVPQRIDRRWKTNNWPILTTETPSITQT